MYWKKALFGAIMTVTTAVIPAITYAQAYGTVATQTLNVREGAKKDRAIVEQLDYKDPVEIVDETGDWVKVILANDERGYVHTDYLSIHRVVAMVTADVLNVRDYPDKNSSKVLGKFEKGEEISVHYKVGDWYKVSQEGFDGYVHKDYIKSTYLKYLPAKNIKDAKRYTLTRAKAQNQTIVSPTTEKPSSTKPNNTKTSTQQQSSSKTSSTTAQKQSSKPASTGNRGQQIVEDAKKFIGNPYVYGGNSLTNGVDCSGFTQQIMARHGISISRSSSAQYANNGYSISSKELQPGDLTFYGYNGKVSHVAIYTGNGRVVHANDERTGITTSNVFPSGGKPYIGAKRVVK